MCANMVYFSLLEQYFFWANCCCSGQLKEAFSLPHIIHLSTLILIPVFFSYSICRVDYLNAFCPGRPTDTDRLKILRTRYVSHSSWSFTLCVLTLEGLEELLWKNKNFIYIYDHIDRLLLYCWVLSSSSIALLLDHFTTCKLSSFSFPWKLQITVMHLLISCFLSLYLFIHFCVLYNVELRFVMIFDYLFIK